MNEAFGKEVINSYLKLRSSEIKEFKQNNKFKEISSKKIGRNETK